jgi:predicted TIM-barrel fold metal-dependent hydrolase
MAVSVGESAVPSAAQATGEVIVSADSHVMEPLDLWVKRLPASLRDQAPFYEESKLQRAFQGHPGGHDPNARIGEMETDGVSAEVLYATQALVLFGLDDARLQEACFRIFNDWLIEYCQVAPRRLLGIACMPTYDIKVAVDELERCKKAGLVGAQVWQAPHPDLPFSSGHYDPLWAAAQDMQMPVSMHILTGHGYAKEGPGALDGVERYRGSVVLKLTEIMNALFDLVHYGALERFPELKLVIVENEIGWLPWLLQQWDYYYRRHGKVNPLPIGMPPSAYFDRQVYATFFNDRIGGHLLDVWGQDNCMWSNDFPHPNSTWPNSRQVIEQHLGHLPADARGKLVRGNVARLYGLHLPAAA